MEMRQSPKPRVASAFFEAKRLCSNDFVLHSISKRNVSNDDNLEMMFQK